MKQTNFSPPNIYVTRFEKNVVLTCVSKGFLCVYSSVVAVDPLDDKGWPGGLLCPVGLGLFFR